MCVYMSGHEWTSQYELDNLNIIWRPKMQYQRSAASPHGRSSLQVAAFELWPQLCFESSVFGIHLRLNQGEQFAKPEENWFQKLVDRFPYFEKLLTSVSQDERMSNSTGSHILKNLSLCVSVHDWDPSPIDIGRVIHSCDLPELMINHQSRLNNSSLYAIINQCLLALSTIHDQWSNIISTLNDQWSISVALLHINHWPSVHLPFSTSSTSAKSTILQRSASRDGRPSELLLLRLLLLRL